MTIYFEGLKRNNLHTFVANDAFNLLAATLHSLCMKPSRERRWWQSSPRVPPEINYYGGLRFLSFLARSSLVCRRLST